MQSNSELHCPLLRKHKRGKNDILLLPRPTTRTIVITFDSVVMAISLPSFISFFVVFPRSNVHYVILSRLLPFYPSFWSRKWDSPCFIYFQGLCFWEATVGNILFLLRFLTFAGRSIFSLFQTLCFFSDSLALPYCC